jgi:prevent-host-death family protein
MGLASNNLTNLINQRVVYDKGPFPLVEAKVMAKLVSLYAAKTRFSKLVDRAGNGEEIIVSKSGKPTARLMPLAFQDQPRKQAGALGRITIREDFDTPLPPEIKRTFEGR